MKAEIISQTLITLVAIGFSWSLFIFADKSNWSTGVYSFTFYFMLPALTVMMILTPIIVLYRRYKIRSKDEKLVK